MEHGDDTSGSRVLDEVDRVREAARALAANDGVREPKDRSGGELVRVAQAFEHAVHGRDEVVAESLALFFVPDRGASRSSCAGASMLKAPTPSALALSPLRRGAARWRPRERGRVQDERARLRLVDAAHRRDPAAVSKATGAASNLLAVKLDVTKRADAEAAVRAAVDRLGRIDVLVNNAASFYAGYFEELSPEHMDKQLATSLVGPMNVTRAVLPVMRKQKAGHIIAISSSAGFAGFELGTAYAASKFGLEGFMDSLHPEVAPFGICTTVVNPGFFRTELLTEQSTQYAEASIDDYAARREPLQAFWRSQNGKQADPKKLAHALITIAAQKSPPRRFIAGADAVASAEQKLAEMKAQIEGERELS